ncbi:hypothetical protein FACS189474_0320 [Bacteroidia bacterium]|nr:hypothetical protein FACS189474_0320 [Bacteroidia bacterium]
MLGFLNAAMASATQRFMSYSEGAGDKEKQKSIFNISVILHFFIAIIIGIVLLIAEVKRDKDKTNLNILQNKASNLVKQLAGL